MKDKIKITGARVHNLKDVSLELPKKQTNRFFGRFRQRQVQFGF